MAANHRRDPFDCDPNKTLKALKFQGLEWSLKFFLFFFKKSIDGMTDAWYIISVVGNTDRKGGKENEKEHD